MVMSRKPTADAVSLLEIVRGPTPALLLLIFVWSLRSARFPLLTLFF